MSTALKCHMTTHKSKGEKQLGAVCLFRGVWSPTKWNLALFFDNRKMWFPNMLCLVRRNWKLGKLFIFHHGNEYSQCSRSASSKLKAIGPACWCWHFIQEGWWNIWKEMASPIAFDLLLGDKGCNLERISVLTSLHTKWKVIWQSVCVNKAQHIHAQLFKSNSLWFLLHDS